VVVEIKMKNIIWGLVLGLIVFLGPGFLDGNFGLVGSDYLLNYLPNGLLGLIILGIVYVFIGGIIFFLLKSLLNKNLNMTKTDIMNLTLKFGFGISLAYIITMILILNAFSNFGF